MRRASRIETTHCCSLVRFPHTELTHKTKLSLYRIVEIFGLDGLTRTVQYCSLWAFWAGRPPPLLPCLIYRLAKDLILPFLTRVPDLSAAPGTQSTVLPGDTPKYVNVDVLRNDRLSLYVRLGVLD